LTDAELAKGLSNRDPSAMDELVAQYHRDVYRFLRHLTRHSQDAEDLAQQTLIRALDRADRFSGTGTFRSWLLGVAYREFTGWKRKRFWLPLLGDRTDPNDAFARFDESEALLAAMAKLPDPTRAVFLMHYVEDLSVLDISRALAIPEGTVKSRLHSARNSLRTELKEGSYVPETC
jgi:RNA polymerase sigma-70 factor (ECF subfamily)